MPLPLSPQLRDLLRQLAASACQLVAADLVSVGLLDEPAQALHMVVSEPGDDGPAFALMSVPLRGTLAIHAARRRATVIAADLPHERRLSPIIRAELRRVGVAACACIPLVARGHALGVLYADYRQPGMPPTDKVRLLEVFAASAALALDHAQLQEEARLVDEAARRFAASLEPERVVAEVAGQVRALLAADLVSLWLLSPDGQDVELRVRSCDDPTLAEHVAALTRVALTGNTLTARAVRTRRLQLSRHYQRDRRLPEEHRRGSPIGSSVVAPLIAAGRALGTINVARGRPAQPFGQREARLLEALTDRAAPAVANAQLYAAARQAEAYQRAMRDMALAIGARPDLEGVLTQVAEHARSLAGAQFAIVGILHGSEAQARAVAGPGHDYAARAFGATLDPRSPRSHGPVGRALRERRPVVMADVADPAVFVTRREEILAHGVRSYTVVPLVAADHVLGTLQVYADRPQAFSEDDVARLADLAAQAAGAVHAARLLDEEQVLRAVGQHVAAVQQDFAAVLNAIDEGARSLLAADSVRVALLSPDGAWLDLHWAERDAPPRNSRIPAGQSLAGEAARRRQVLVVQDLGDASALGVANYRAIVEEGFVCLAFAPLLAGEECLGALYTRHRTYVPFTPDYLRLLESLAVQAATAVRNSRLYTEAQAHARQLAARNLQLIGLQSLGRDIAADLDPGAVLDRLLDAAIRLTHSTGARAYLAPRGSQPSLRRVAGSHRDDCAWLSEVTPWIQAILRGTPILANNAPTHPEVDPALARRGDAQHLIGVPLRVGGDVLGTLSASRAPGEPPYTEDDLGLLNALAVQAGMAVHNALLYATAQRHSQRLLELHRLSLAVGESAQLESALGAIVVAAARLCGGEGADAWLWRPEEGALECVASWGHAAAPGTRHPIDTGALGTAFREGPTLVVHDYLNQATADELARNLGLQACVTAQLHHGGERVGVLGVVSVSDPQAFGPDDERLLALIAETTALAIVNARLAEERQARARELAARSTHLAELQRVTQAITSDLDLGTLLERLMEATLRLTGSRAARVYLAATPERPALYRAAGPRRETVEAMNPGHFAAVVLAGGVPLVANHATEHPLVDHERARQLEAEHLMGAPLLLGGRAVGVLTAVRGPGQPPFTKDDVALLASLAEQAAVAAHNASRFEAIRASEEHYRLLAESMHEMVAVVDAEMRLTYVNQRIQEVLGYTRDELLGHPSTDFVAPTSVAIVQAHFARGMRGSEPAATYELDLLARDGTVIPAEVSSVSVLRDGHPVERQLVLRDLRPRRAALERFLRDEKLRALGQLASGVAHDLNQYLGLVAGHGELGLRALDEPVPDLQSVRESLEVMVGAALDGGASVRRLQSFARPVHDQAAQPVVVGELLHEVAALTAPRWRDTAQQEGRPIRMTVEAHGDTTVDASPAALREALTNLVFNAVDALPHGGTIHLIARAVTGDRARQTSGAATVAAEPTTCLPPCAPAPGVEVLVIDDGEGMTPEVVAKCFEPFFSTKGERGSGMGLAMVFGIVQRHGGQVSIQSTPGQGTTVRLLLRREIRATSDKGTGDSALSPTAPSSPLPSPVSRLSILAVDDEPALVRVMKRALSMDGHRVRTAHSGEEALALLSEEAADVLVTDLGLGAGMNGMQLAEEARRHCPGLRVILATGWGAEIDPAEARTQGIEAVLAKPYRIADLRRAVRDG